MKVLSIVCQKGGCAKTTTAINLAVEATRRGLEVALIDLDPQVSACDWKDIRGDKPPVVAATPVPHLERTLRAAAEGAADLAIIDTAGRANDAMSAAARAADLILMPLQPSLADLNTVSATLDIIRISGGKPIRALLARVRVAGNRAEETTAWLAARGVEACPSTLGERVIFQDAYAMGLGVSEAEPGGKAAEEIHQVYNYTSLLLGLPTQREIADEKARSARKRTA
ncbi:MAG: AAA family ATPase [Acetobacteraceae bacterium]|nr:AAA family ATPase [Acetobacteraceae bacterium]